MASTSIPAPGMQDYDPEQLDTAKSKCKTGCLRFLKQVFGFLFSHIGLLSLVVGYCMLGAVIFEELEQPNEILVKRNMTATREAVTEQLWDITREMEVLHQENWTSEVTSQLRRFEKSLIIAMKERGWDGKEDEAALRWTFGGSLFYSITVITTIGYGHIAPKTAAAKVVTIFYAILGIPLTVLCWSNIGDAMANAFRFCYWRIFCYLCTRKPPRGRRRRHLSRHSPRSRSTSVRHRSPPLSRNPSRGRSLRRSQRTSQRSDDRSETSTISYSIAEQERFFEDNVAQEKENLNNAGVLRKNEKAQDLDVELITAPASSTAEPEAPPKKQSAASRMARGLGGMIRRGDRESQKSQKSNASNESVPATPLSVVPPSTGGGLHWPSHRSTLRQISAPPNLRLAEVPEDVWSEDAVSYYYDYPSDDEVDEYSTKPVPIWLSLCLVIAYIVWGAFIFQEWEGWSLLDSGYFCFITLTTIGFGDLVPTQEGEGGEERLALCSIYLLFGIAMIAMSFNLVQEQVINNVKELGRQCGILKDDDDDDDY